MGHYLRQSEVLSSVCICSMHPMLLTSILICMSFTLKTRLPTYPFNFWSIIILSYFINSKTIFLLKIILKLDPSSLHGRIIWRSLKFLNFHMGLPLPLGELLQFQVCWEFCCYVFLRSNLLTWVTSIVRSIGNLFKYCTIYIYI